MWAKGRAKLPAHVEVVLSDISDGMLRDARRTIGLSDERFYFRVFPAQKIPYGESEFDLVVADHVLFYCEDVEKACREIRRVLKP